MSILDYCLSHEKGVTIFWIAFSFSHMEQVVSFPNSIHCFKLFGFLGTCSSVCIGNKLVYRFRYCFADTGGRVDMKRICGITAAEGKARPEKGVKVLFLSHTVIYIRKKN